MGARWALTARGEALEQLGRAFIDGRVGGVLLSGPAGVGKTRLADEALQSAGPVPTGRAVGHAATRKIPLGALAHLLPASLVRDVGLGDEDRARLFHQGRLSLAERAGGERLVLVLDDIDQLDDTSLALLLPLTLDRVVFVIATLRSGQAVPPVVESMVKDGHFDVWELPPLRADEVATLLHRVLDGPVDASSVDQLAEASGGNLQVLREIVRRAVDEGALAYADGVWRLERLPIPTRLEALVASRLAELEDAERHVVDLLAIAGSIGITDLEPFVGEARLEHLEDRGFITVSVERRRVHATLAHPLYGEALRQQMSPLRTRRLTRDLADRVERHGARRRDDLIRLATWRLDAGGKIDPEVLVGAGRLALVGRDADLATRFALTAADMGARFEAARILVEAALLAGDLASAEAAFAEVGVDPSLGDLDRVQLSRRLAAACTIHHDLEGAVAAIDDALERVTDPAARALARAQRALLLGQQGRPLDVLAVLDGLSDMEDPRLRSEVLAARSQAETLLGRYEDAIASARAGAQAASELPAWLTRESMARHVLNEMYAYAYLASPEDARTLAFAALAASGPSDAGGGAAWYELVLGQIALVAGEGRPGLVHYETAASAAARTGQDAGLVWALTGQALAHLLLGDLDSAVAARDRADAIMPSPLGGAVALRARLDSWTLAAGGDLAGARRLALGAADAMQAEGLYSGEAWLRHDVVRFGAPDKTVERLDELASQIDGAYVGIVARLAHAAIAGDRDAYGVVVDEFEAAGLIADAAESASVLAELHRRAGDQRGATAADQRVARLVEGAGGRTPALRRGGEIEPLTEREREVALLAASGASSKDIAARLYVSARTVDTHLARTYRKLGISGREELRLALGRSSGAQA